MIKLTRRVGRWQLTTWTARLWVLEGSPWPSGHDGPAPNQIGVTLAVAFIMREEVPTNCGFWSSVISVTWCHSSGIKKAFFGTVCCLLTLVHIFATCNYTCGWPFAQFLCVQSTVEETFGGGSVDWTWWAFCISVLSLFLKTLWSGRPAQNAGSTDQLSKCLHDCNSPYPNGIHLLNLQ